MERTREQLKTMIPDHITRDDLAGATATLYLSVEGLIKCIDDINKLTNSVFIPDDLLDGTRNYVLAIGVKYGFIKRG